MLGQASPMGLQVIDDEWEQIRPLLDHALDTLPHAKRQVLIEVLRGISRLLLRRWASVAMARMRRIRFGHVAPVVQPPG